MSFRDIKGHDQPIQILKSCIAHNRLSKAYLFVGPDGIGKRLTAVTLAKVLNCHEGLSDSCDRCNPCLKINKNQHPDIHIIDVLNKSDTSAVIKIEDIRQLQRDINLRPYEGKRKVFIINDAHSLTAEAANALLKILEEPPQDSLIILISSKPQLLFKTIISRCQVLKFFALVRIKLKEILKKDYNLDDTLAHFLAYFCEGRLGKALSLKDTDVLNYKNRIIDTFVLSNNAVSGNLPMQNRVDVVRYLNTLATWFRDIYIAKIGMPQTELINIDRRFDLLRQINRYSFTELNGILNSISDSLLYLEQNINVRLLISNLRAQLWRRQF